MTIKLVTAGKIDNTKRTNTSKTRKTIKAHTLGQGEYHA